MDGLRCFARVRAKEKLLAPVLLMALIACGDSRSDYEKAQEQLEEDLQAARANATRDAIADLDRQEREWSASKGPAPHGLAACKASVGILMSQEPRIMSGRELGDYRFSVSYRREDGTRWEYTCEATSNRLRWTNVEGGQEGRQRQEDDIRYTVKGAILEITTRGIDGKDYDWRFRLPALREIKG